MQRSKAPAGLNEINDSSIEIKENKLQHVSKSEQPQVDSKESHSQSIPVRIDRPKLHPQLLTEIQSFSSTKLKHVMVQSANVWWHSFVAIVSESAQARKKTRASAPTVISFDKKTDYFHIEPKTQLSSCWQIDLKSMQKKEASVKSYPLIKATI